MTTREVRNQLRREVEQLMVTVQKVLDLDHRAMDPDVYAETVNRLLHEAFDVLMNPKTR